MNYSELLELAIIAAKHDDVLLAQLAATFEQ